MERGKCLKGDSSFQVKLALIESGPSRHDGKFEIGAQVLDVHGLGDSEGLEGLVLASGEAGDDEGAARGL